MHKDPEKRRESVRISTRKHYRNNKQQYLERNRKAQATKLAFVRALREAPCKDCGVKYPYYVMEFDHRDSKLKKFSLGRIQSCTWKALHAEIEKCDVVCANCHRTRTHLRRSGEMADTPVSETGFTAGSSPASDTNSRASSPTAEAAASNTVQSAFKSRDAYHLP